MDRGSQLDEEDEDDENDKDDEEDEVEEEEEEKDEEEEEEKRKEEETTDIKSNNPHLAGGEQHCNWGCGGLLDYKGLNNSFILRSYGSMHYSLISIYLQCIYMVHFVLSCTCVISSHQKSSQTRGDLSSTQLAPRLQMGGTRAGRSGHCYISLW